MKALYRRAQARMGPASAVDADRDAAIQDAGSHGMVRLVVVFGIVPSGSSKRAFENPKPLPKLLEPFGRNRYRLRESSD